MGWALRSRVRWKEVFPFPDEAGFPRGIAVELATGGGTTDFPLLGGFVEPDIRGPEDFEPSERTEINCLGVEAIHTATRVDAERGFHASLPPSCCWLEWRLDCRQ